MMKDGKLKFELKSRYAAVLAARPKLHILAACGVRRYGDNSKVEAWWVRRAEVAVIIVHPAR